MPPEDDALVNHEHGPAEEPRRRHRHPLDSPLGKIAVRLRAARKAAGFKTFEAAAAAAGIDVNTLKSYEWRWAVPTALKLQQLAKTYRVSSDWLLGLVEAPQLHAGLVLQDVGEVEAILACTTEQEILQHISWPPRLLACLASIPERYALVPAEEAARVQQRLDVSNHLTSAPRQWALITG
jgi:transcriptional regulator with XRE-family HTH domain